MLVYDGLLCRAEKIMCAALDDENEISKPTSACWVGERANCFAVGYDDGSILLYGVPPAALQGDRLTGLMDTEGCDHLCSWPRTERLTAGTTWALVAGQQVQMCLRCDEMGRFRSLLQCRSLSRLCQNLF